LGSLPVRGYRSGLAVGVLVVALVAGAVGAVVAVGSQSAGKTVSYLGLNFTVPDDWPVITVSPTSTTCVRFDQHAVYLGIPGVNQDCPAGLIGSTEAMLVQPGSAATTTSTVDTTGRQISVTTPTVTITAKYSTDEATIDSVITSAGLPLPTPVTPSTAVQPKLRANATVATLPNDATNFLGKGFDACAAPSQPSMTTWKSASPYSAVGIYIGGANRSCDQPNLTAAWVSAQYTAGWRFLPIYVGLQARDNQLTNANAQGIAAADDAVAKAAGLAIGPGNVLYDDMEAYTVAQQSGALAFESGWTAELHKKGYFAGVYSSSGSGITDLVSHYGGLSTPDVSYAARWNQTADTDDAAIPAADWANHQRVHQYDNTGVAGETFGGVNIKTDDDFLDVGIAGTAVPTVHSAYQTVAPRRVLDTRAGTGAPKAALGAGQTISVPITGLPANATAVVLNVTVTSPSTTSFLSVYPDGVPVPTASSLNFTRNETIPNLVTVPVYDGSVRFFNHVGSTHVLADLFGYYTTGTGFQYHQLAPTRLLDTRSGLGAPRAKLGAGQTVDLTVGGVAGIPATVTAVIMNITAVNPTDASFLTAFAGGTTLPTVSNVNFTRNETIPNLAIVPVGNGVVSIFNHVGTVDVLGDVLGYFTAGTTAQFTPTAPTRLLDTRAGTGTAGRRTPVGANGVVKLKVAGTAGIPAGVEAVVLNVTAVSPTATSFLTVYPDGQARPGVSNLNFTRNETIPNAVIVPVVNGSVDFYNHVGSVHVVADIAGYFTG
jgi:hypothetical protein